jgi:hypothetical protein
LKIREFEGHQCGIGEEVPEVEAEEEELASEGERGV